MSTREMYMNEINALSDENIEILYSIAKILFPQTKSTTLTESQKAFKELETLRRPFKNPVVDEKEEYRRYLEVKYGNID